MAGILNRQIVRRAGRVLLVPAVIALVVCLVKTPLLQYLANNFKALLSDPDFSMIVLLTTLGFGVIHLFVVNKKEVVREHLFFRSLGPIIASPLTSLTCGAIFNSSLILVYIVCFDESTLKKYGGWDKSTVIFTSIALLVWSLYVFAKMIGDIWDGKEEKAGVMSEAPVQSNQGTAEAPAPPVTLDENGK